MNDPFNKEKCNVCPVMLKTTEEEWLSFYLVKAIKIINQGDELFMEYGPEYWHYWPNFLTLSTEQQVECRNYYQLHDGDFYGPKETDVQIQAKASNGSKKGGKK